MLLDLGRIGLSASEAVSVILGAQLRAWRYDAYRTKLRDDQKVSLSQLVVTGAPAGTEDLWAVESAVALGVAFTRELVTEPANVIYPESFVARCRDRFKDSGAEIIVLDEKAMAELGMGALLGVSQGSVRPPRLLAIRWHGGKAGEKPVALVGKGVTFDTGGISIKPAAGMEDMKWDMGGAGAVAGAMLSIVTRKAKANVVGICGLVENMPDGNAQRPGDVVTSMSGQTVEVINTDAEGRLVLCDALTWAQSRFQPSKIVDLATLTGAIIVSLAHEYAGLFSNDDDLAGALTAAGNATGDKLWRFPLGAAYDKMIDSPIADMKNVGGRFGGSITAAQFLQRYIDKGTPWAHLDIAGTVWTDKAGHSWDKGATGFGVRLLDRFVRDNFEQ
jgi:leucyl aminopeptidase